MEPVSALPPALRTGRINLEGLAGVEHLDDWQWHEGIARWAMTAGIALRSTPMRPSGCETVSRRSYRFIALNSGIHVETIA